MYRIAIGEISHETNTFCPPTTLQMFRERAWFRGDEIIRQVKGVRTYLGGMIDEAERLGVTLIPTFAASTEPWGTFKHIITTDPPGISTSTLTQFHYQRLRRPIYSLDPDATYRPAD